MADILYYIFKVSVGTSVFYMILLHESVHSKEKHFYDILTAELLFSLQWFNPFAWLHREAIRTNLEFRADDIVIRESDSRQYQLTILSMVQNRLKPPLFTELNSSNLKKRIIMMKKDNITRFSGIARFVVIPVFTILLLSLSGKETIIIQDHMAEHGISSQETMQSVAIVENSADKVGSIFEMRKYIADNMRYPMNAAESGATGFIEFFARVSDNGIIDEVMETQAEEDYISIDEIVMIGYRAKRVEATESSSTDSRGIDFQNGISLISESRRIINSLPKLEIPELYGKTIKFQFRFVLQ